MTHFHKLLLITLLAPLFSTAQSNYQPGLVVTLKGDTLRGFINFKEWDNNPRYIFFKTDPLGTPSKFTVKDIRYLRVNVDFLVEYQKYEGLISTDNIDIDKIHAERDSTFRLDTVFLKVLQRGKNLVLYSYSDDVKTRYFISENSADSPQELTYRIYYDYNNSKTTGRTVYENNYKEQLYSIGVKANMMNDKLKRYISQADYTQIYLITIASRINGISEADSSKNNLSVPKPFKPVLILAGCIAVGLFLLSKVHF
jgi:hypothetical protein